MYKKVTIVDENDRVVGAEDLLVSLEKGLLRRASRVFVFDDEGKLLLQKRSKNVFQPLLFDQSVGGHVDEGETYHEAAVREMEEELGLRGFEVVEVVTSYKTDIFNGIYKAVIPTGTEILFDSEEVESVMWVAPHELDEMIQAEPAAFTDCFPHIWHDLRAMLTK